MNSLKGQRTDPKDGILFEKVKRPSVNFFVSLPHLLLLVITSQS